MMILTNPHPTVVAAQFWDTYTGLEHTGQLFPEASWTIHGLWPITCNLNLDVYCDFSRQYDPYPSPATLTNGTVIPPYTGPSVSTFIAEFGRVDLLDFSQYSLFVYTLCFD